MKQLKSIMNILIVMLLAFYGTEKFLVNNYIVGKWQFLFVMSYFILMISIIIYLIFRMNIKFSVGIRVLLIIISGCLAWVCREDMLITFPQDEFTVYITATGEKNENSQGTEIWISEITVDNERVDLSTVWHDEAWIYDKSTEYLYAVPENKKSILEFSFIKAGVIRIEFIRHEWSGIVGVDSTNGDTEFIDLYKKDGDSMVYSIDVPRNTNIVWREISFGATWLLIYGILYSGLCIITKLYKKEKSR